MDEGHLLFIGLGNPGKKYALTRHNLGAMAVEEFAHQQGWKFQESKYFCSLVAKGRCKNKEVHLLLPQTYMNESGWAVKKYLEYYKLSQEHVIVVCDDVALMFGQLRVRLQGASGGHNGLKSISTHLGGDSFIRLRMGIGRGDEQRPLADYVLEPFNAAEVALLTAYVKSGAAVLEMVTTETIEQVMNRVNTKLM